MSITVEINKSNYILVTSTLSAFTGPETLVAQEIRERIGKLLQEQKVEKVEDIQPVTIVIDPVELASVKTGLIALANDKITIDQMATLKQTAKLFFISKTVEAAIKAKLPTTLDNNELDNLVELDAE